MTDPYIRGRRCAIYLFRMWLIEETRWKGSGQWIRSTHPWSDELAYLAWQAELETRELLARPRTNHALLEAFCQKGSAQLQLIEDDPGRLYATAKVPHGPTNIAAFHVLRHVAMAINDATIKPSDENL